MVNQNRSAPTALF